jgi:hypothetical protein
MTLTTTRSAAPSGRPCQGELAGGCKLIDNRHPQATGSETGDGRMDELRQNLLAETRGEEGERSFALLCKASAAAASPSRV